MTSNRFNYGFNFLQSRLQTRINHDFKPIQLWLQNLSIIISFPTNQDFKPIQLWLQSLSIKTSDPDLLRLLTRINQDFKPIQVLLQNLSIMISFQINKDFKPIQLWLQSLSIQTSDTDQSRLQTD
jgi:hypothetical protein